MDEKPIRSEKMAESLGGGRIILGFGLVFSLMLFSSAISYYNTHELYQSAREILHSYETQSALGNVLSTMKDVETGARGYVITGDKEFLAPYRVAVVQIQPQIEQLGRLVATDPRHRSNFAALREKIDARLIIAKKCIELREEKGFAAAHEFVAKGEGKIVMDEIRALVEKMDTAGRAALENRTRLDRNKYTTALIAGIITTALGVGLLALAFDLVRRELAARRRNAERLHQQRERFRVTLTSIGDAVIVTDARGIVTFLNPVAGALTGWGTEAIGKSLTDVFHIIHEETRQAVESPVTKVLREGAIVGLANHTHLIARDGTEIPIDDSGAPIRDQQNNIDGVVLVFRDITDRRQATTEMEASEARYRMLFATAQNAILILDGETGRIVEANPFVCQLLGYSHDELFGKELWQLGAPEQTDANHAAFRQLQEQGSIHYDNLPLVTAAGKCVDVEFVSNVYEVDRRKIIQCNIRDITQHKRLEEEMRRRAEQLTDADRRKNEFLAMLAHELRNPLAPIYNAVHLLRQKCPTDAETLWAHDVIERQVKHMARMVDDLLDVSRITRGKINLHKEPTQVSAVVTHAVEMIQPLMNERKHKLSVTLPPEPLRLDADLPRLAQVLANLLNNAAKFTEDGGQIWLTVEPQGNDVLIKVRDTGAGISANDLPHIFDLFSQGDSTLDRTHGGLGIGLTLARILVQMHGGSIQAFSAGIGQGSEFIVRLPRLRTETVALPAPAPPIADHPAKSLARRILVVDDNIDGARSLAIYLQTLGHEVQTAHDGVVALETGRHWRPEVVLLDIGLPRMNGLDVARRLREMLGSDVLLLAMTGYGQDEDRKRSQEAGFNAHLVKPLDLDVLNRLLADTSATKTERS